MEDAGCPPSFAELRGLRRVDVVASKWETRAGQTMRQRLTQEAEADETDGIDLARIHRVHLAPLSVPAQVGLQSSDWITRFRG